MSNVLQHLVEKKNTLIVIEHNLDIIGQADWITDVGPGAGKYGGQLMFEGTVQNLLKSEKSERLPTYANIYRGINCPGKSGYCLSLSWKYIESM